MAALGSVILLTACGFLLERIAFFHLPDGTKIRLNAVRFGRQMPFYLGEFWQWPFFAVFGTNLPPKIAGSEQVFVSRNQGGSVSVAFTRYADSGNLKALPLSILRVDVQTRSGDLLPCTELASNPLRKRVKGKPEIVAMQTLWELPAIKEREIHLLVSYLDQNAGVATVKEFRIENPASSTGGSTR